MLGQPASSQTVCSPSRFTRPLSSVYSGPVRSVVLIQEGFFSIGVSALRTSSRSSLRPSGATAVMRRLLVIAIRARTAYVRPGSRAVATGAYAPAHGPAHLHRAPAGRDLLHPPARREG